MKKLSLFITLLSWSIILTAEQPVTGTITGVKDSNGVELGNNQPQLGEEYTIEFVGTNIRDLHIRTHTSTTVSFHENELPDQPSQSNIDIYLGSFSEGNIWTTHPGNNKYISLLLSGDGISHGSFKIRINNGQIGKTRQLGIIFTRTGQPDPFMGKQNSDYKVGRVNTGVSQIPVLHYTQTAEIGIIPTLSQWGVIILILLTLTVGMVFLYVRQTTLAMPGGMQVTMPGMKPKLFDKKLYGKMSVFALLAGVCVLGLLYAYFGEITSADPFGTFVSMAIVAYMVHFVLLNRKNKVANKE